MPKTPAPPQDIRGARVLAVLGDSVTTDHISPAGSIQAGRPRRQIPDRQWRQARDFNSYGARRGNHEVMVRGTFANIRLRNLLAPGTEGGWTLHQPGGEKMTIYDAAVRYEQEKVPLMVLAGKEYGSGSSRDWAAKGPLLLGVRAVIAGKLRAHPPQQPGGHGHSAAGIPAGRNAGIAGAHRPRDLHHRGSRRAGAAQEDARARAGDGGKEKVFSAITRVDTPEEVAYYRNGGILPYVLRQML